MLLLDQLISCDWHKRDGIECKGKGKMTEKEAEGAILGTTNIDTKVIVVRIWSKFQGRKSLFFRKLFK